MRKFVALALAAVVAVTLAASIATFILSSPASVGSPAGAAPPPQAPGDGCNEYVGGVCVVYAGDSDTDGDTIADDTWYCDPSFGWDSTEYCTSTINVGDTVRWVNVGDLPHTATECPPAECYSPVPLPYTPLFGEEILSPGDTLEFTFDSQGTWRYYCYIHPLQPYGIVQVLPPSDKDGDTVPDTSDNCPNTANAGQEDKDGDALGDACEADFGTDPNNPDTDGDGCTDGGELGPDENLGGLRDPTNPYDFFDTPLPPGDPGTGTKSGTVSISDITGVIAKFGTADGGPPNDQGQNYNPDFDRTLVGPDPWDLGPPSGAVNINDIVNVIAQFGHSCTASP